MNFEDDPSIRFRLNVTNQTIDEALERPITGYGVGQVIKIEHGNEFMSPLYIDNSFVTVLYKSGIVGFSLLILLYGYYLVRIIALMIKLKKKKEVDVWAITQLAIFPALIVWGVSTVMLTNYRVIIIIATMMATVAILNNIHDRDKAKLG